MALWTEYEGKTIDGTFPLNRLLRPEGASAFFTTTKDGIPRIIRLIETHSGQDDILSRWRGVHALDHPNILRLEDYGQVVVDRTTLLYAVMEPVDAKLSEVVGVQRLTLEEVQQLAVSLLSVLEALHSHGFIHGHIEPAHVVAVHEIVKLQCDSIRDSPEGQLGQDLKRRDVQDLAALLLLALTQERTLDTAAAQLPLPTPFDSIVKKGMSGEWSLAEIAAALKIAPETPPDPVRHVAPGTDAASATASPSQQMPLFVGDTTAGLAPKELSTADENLQESPLLGPKHEQQERKQDRDIFRLIGWIVVALAVVLLAVLTISWQFLPAAKLNANAHSAPVTGHSPPPVPQASSPISQQPSEPSPSAPAATGAQWRVIAYNYRREAQARKKADRIARRHPALHPEVVRPDASNRYLVSVGGPLEHERAEALAKDLRHQGFPRNTHALQVATEER